MMEIGKKYMTEEGSIEEVVFIRLGVAYCVSGDKIYNTPYGWDAVTGDSLSLGTKYNIKKTVTLAEVRP